MVDRFVFGLVRRRYELQLLLAGRNGPQTDARLASAGRHGFAVATEGDGAEEISGCRTRLAAQVPRSQVPQIELAVLASRREMLAARVNIQSRENGVGG